MGPAAAGGDDEGLAQRMGVPGGLGAGFKRDIGGRNPSKMFQRGCAGEASGVREKSEELENNKRRRWGPAALTHSLLTAMLA